MRILVPDWAAQQTTLAPGELRIRVLGPEAPGPGRFDVQQLFPGERLTRIRRDRLGRCSRLMAYCDDLPVGIAAYEVADGQFRVYEFGVNQTSTCLSDDIVGKLAENLELACLASGGGRMQLHVRTPDARAILLHRGYRASDGAGTWLQKTVR